MNKEDIICRLNELAFDKTEYWLVTGSAMVLYGIKEETSDIDLGCSTKLADELEAKGCAVTVLEDGTRRLSIGDDVELFENWLYDAVAVLEDIPVISLKGLLEMKQSLGREKDHKDIERIKAFLGK